MCPLDILSQNLYDKTKDVGKRYGILIPDEIPEILIGWATKLNP
jgi:hypothetical protein